jgi:membrane protein implicated in regulation of membrane protease activity
MDPMFFFYLTGAAMLFLVVSMILGHGHLGHGHGAGHVGGHGSGSHGGGAGHAHGGGGSSGHGAAHGPGGAGAQTAGSALQSGHAESAHPQAAVSGFDNMSIWSFQMLFLFVGGFGVGGYFASLSRLSFFLTMLVGAAGGVALTAIGYSVINLFYRRQTDSNISSEEYIGLTGIVVTSIGPGSVGQVRCQIGTSRDVFLAKSLDGAGIPINSTVRITGMVGSTAIVEIADPDQPLIEMPWRN